MGDFEASAVVERVATGPGVAIGLQANHLVPGGLHNLGFNGPDLRSEEFGDESRSSSPRQDWS